MKKQLNRQSATQPNQTGIALIGAIFIMVVLSAIGVYMLSLNASQHTSTSLSLQSNRALYAAESGIEWTAWYVRTNDSCPSPSTSFDIGNFQLDIDQCLASTITEGVNSYMIFDVEVSATTKNNSFGDNDYSKRTLLSRIAGS